MRRPLQHVLVLWLVAVYGTGTARLAHVQLTHGAAHAAIHHHHGSVCAHQHAARAASDSSDQQGPIDRSPDDSHDDCSTCQQMSVGGMAMAPALAPLPLVPAIEMQLLGDAQDAPCRIGARDIAARAPPTRA